MPDRGRLPQPLFFASAPRHLGSLLADELRALGLPEVSEARGGARFGATLEDGYRACLWSRVANRVLLPLASFAAADPDELYAGALGIPWEDHLALDLSFAIQLDGQPASAGDSRFPALRVKDAIADRLTARWGCRPNVDTKRPDLLIHVHLHQGTAILSLDLSGGSLHRRGYRIEGSAAPLKENLAAALLLRAGWPELAAAGGALLDPMCGSGTLIVEGTLMAADIAPALARPAFGFEAWPHHEPALWARLRAEALDRREQGLQRLRGTTGTAAPALARGYDRSPEAIRVAIDSLARAGLTGLAHFERRALDDCRPARAGETGLLIVNPPYGERLGADSELPALYARLGEILRERFQGWRAALLTGNPELGKTLGLRARRLHSLYNGPIPCRLLHFQVDPADFVTPGPRAGRGSAQVGWPEAGRGGAADGAWPSAGARRPDPSGTERPFADSPVATTRRPELPGATHASGAPRPPERPAAAQPPEPRSAGATMFANRLTKNLKSLRRWLRDREIHCYRLYDADLPDHALAIDVYRGDADPEAAEPPVWAHVQEYAPPASIDPERARTRLREALAVIPEVLGIPPDRVFLKVREQQKGANQYQRLASTRRFHVVREDRHRFWVNFEDYLDTGIFLDHRDTRRLIGELAAGASFLNLFGYTGTATVYAAGGGARSTTTVDLSRTYLDWAGRNLLLNGFDGLEHELIQADCLEWLERMAGRRRFDLIFLDPPSFSNSRRMRGTLDIQRDQTDLILAAARLLEPEGRLIFSNNLRRFRLDLDALPGLGVEDLGARTRPRDFARNPRIHHCWSIRPRP